MENKVKLSLKNMQHICMKMHSFSHKCGNINTKKETQIKWRKMNRETAKKNAVTGDLNGVWSWATLQLGNVVSG